MTKHTILFIAANPHTSNPLKLAEECAAIQRELKLVPHRDDFHFESRWAVSIDELMRHLNELDPSIIHFSGHGGGSSGVMLQDEQGQPQLVTARALSMMVEAAGHGVRVVLLNACYTAVQADVLRAKVDCVVGMAGAIGDDAARSFAIRFYGALGNRRSIGNAVAQGVAALAAKQLPDELLPRCMTRDGVVADDVTLSPNGEELGSRQVSSPQTQARTTTGEVLLAQLSELLPSQFEEVLYRAKIPSKHLPGASAAQTARAIEALRYIEQQKQLEVLARIIRQVLDPR
jgi:hypothetical protein